MSYAGSQTLTRRTERRTIAADSAATARITRDPSMSSRAVILTVILVAVAAAGIWVWRLTTAEPMGGFRDFPWTYITEANVGADETRVIINRGTINGPTSVEDEASGQIAWPAFVHPDPTVVPLIDGRQVIFPLIPVGNGSRTPVIPGLKRPLKQREMEGAVRYFDSEGRKRMDAFRKEMDQ